MPKRSKVPKTAGATATNLEAVGDGRGGVHNAANNGKGNGVFLVPQAHGGALNSGGTPGNSGGGRSPDAFKALMASLADRAGQAMAAGKVLDDASGPMYLDAAKWVADRGYGKAHQSVDMTTDGQPMRTQVLVVNGVAVEF